MMTTGDNYRFIATSTSADADADAADKKTKHLARSHAIKQALEKKRRAQQRAGLNFRISSTVDFPDRRRRSSPQQQDHQHDSRTVETRLTVNRQADVFHMLATGSQCLQKWLQQNSPMRPKGSVISIAEERILPNLVPAFRTSLDDVALVNAALLLFSSAAKRTLDVESLCYQSQAMEAVRERLSSPERAVSESTVATILLLAGVEARLAIPIQLQLHLNAIQQLLNLCQFQGVALSEDIKRAIFWQDLTSSIMNDSKRIVDHKTFPELEWKRDPFSAKTFVLPRGFQKVSHLLNDQFVELLEDIHALQCIRESTYLASDAKPSTLQLDNHQASIQSRLANSEDSPSPILYCCRVAAYLCSAMLRCKIWRDSTIPSQLVVKLLDRLKQVRDDPVWRDHPDMLVWLVFIGGAFSPTEAMERDFRDILLFVCSLKQKELWVTWGRLGRILKDFIWSEKAFGARVRRFWEVHFA